jgi:hypothetical protein
MTTGIQLTDDTIKVRDFPAIKYQLIDKHTIAVEQIGCEDDNQTQ